MTEPLAHSLEELPVMRTLACFFALTLAIAAFAADPNWLTNPGFEDAQGEAPAAWSLGMEGKGEGEAVWQQGEAFAGTRCLRVKLNGPGDYFMGRQYLTQAVKPWALYQLSGWYRSDAELVAHPCVYYVNAAGQVISAWETSLPQASQWTRFHFTFRPPDGTVKFELQMRVQQYAGTAWFDDLFLGPAAAYEAEVTARMVQTRQAVRQGPLALKALRPSERPQLSDLAEPARWEELQKADAVSLFAARDERESFGAVVQGLGFEQALPQATDLTGPRGAVIPAREIKLRWVDWVQAKGVWVPDPLFDKPPFVAPLKGVPILWVTIHVPADKTPPGLYKGEVSLKAGDKTATLPVRLQIYDFALPRTSYLPSSFWIFRHTIRNVYGLKEVPWDFYTKFLDLCLEARLAPIDAAEWHDQPLVQMVRDGKGQLQVDWAPWDQYLQYCMDRGMTAFNVADDHWFGNYFQSFQVRDRKTGQTETVKLDPASQEYADTVTRFFRLAHEHFTRKGWAARAYLQGYDEPGQDPKLLAEIKRFYDLARQGWPGLPTLITTPIGFPGLEDSIGLWCPLTPNYDDQLAAAARAKGQKVWWYVCCGPTAPWANFFLTQPGAAHRVLFWQTFGRKSEGLLYWGVNHWPSYAAREMAPLREQQRWPVTLWDDGNRDGDGYFLYPGPEGPLTSLRFEIMRDGVEDYDALRMLEELLQQKGERVPAALRARAAKTLTLSPGVYRSMTTYPVDAGDMVERRREVNELIERLAKL